MIQQTGITLNNSHLLRAAMAFAVIGVIGPGLFQLKPPQWLGSDAPEQSVEVLSPPAEVGGEVARGWPGQRAATLWLCGADLRGGGGPQRRLEAVLR